MKRISSFLNASPGFKSIPVAKPNAMRHSFTLTLLFSLLLTAGLFCSTAISAQEAPILAPAVIINPTQGEPPVTMMVKGGGFDPYAAVDIYFDLTDMALTVTNGGGSFGGGGLQGGIPVPVPKDAVQGAHWITAVERYGIKAAQTKFVVGTDWAQFHYSPDHKGFNPYETVLSPDTVGNLGLRWSYQTGDPGPRNNLLPCSPAVVANGVVYVAEYYFSEVYYNGFSYVYALNATTGALLWNYEDYDFGFFWSSSLAVANGVVYVGGEDGYFYAMDATTGALLWHYRNDSRSSPAVADGVVYTVSSANTLSALNASTGALLWEYGLGPSSGYHGDLSSPAVANGVVYVGSEDNNLYALNAGNGALLWQYTTGGPIYSSPAVANGVVYVGSDDGNVYALDASTGALLWQYMTGGPISQSSPAVANGVVYVGSRDDNLYALNAISGALLWKYAIGGVPFYDVPTPAVANGVVYVGRWALNASTGAVLWQYGTGGFSSPAVANGVVYMASPYGKLDAFHLPGSLSPDKLNPPERPDPALLTPDWSLQPSAPVTRSANDLN